MIRKASYLKSFNCIGGACEDNCCIGWSVEIDRKTHATYGKIKDPELKRLIREKIYRNEEAYDETVDFALVELTNENRCPFLNGQNLCEIQAKMGEDHLSNVCATYPRMTNEIDGILEGSATISCPEIARLILGSREKLTFEQEKAPPGRNIISIRVDTRQKDALPIVKHLLKLRDFTICILQQRELILSERFIALGLFYQEVQREMETNKGKNLDEILLLFHTKLKEGKLKKKIDMYEKDEMGQADVLMKITEILNDPKEIDSQEYLSFIRESKQGSGAGKAPKQMFEKHMEAYTLFYEPFMGSREYMLENYLVNFVFQSLFPASLSESPYEAYQKLVYRYRLIQFYLIGIAGHRKGLDEITVIKFIQVFSKASEHHYSYFEKFDRYMKSNNYEIMYKKK